MSGGKWGAGGGGLYGGCRSKGREIHDILTAKYDSEIVTITAASKDETRTSDRSKHRDLDCLVRGGGRGS